MTGGAETPAGSPWRPWARDGLRRWIVFFCALAGGMAWMRFNGTIPAGRPVLPDVAVLAAATAAVAGLEATLGVLRVRISAAGPGRGPAWLRPALFAVLVPILVFWAMTVGGGHALLAHMQRVEAERVAGPPNGFPASAEQAKARLLLAEPPDDWTADYQKFYWPAERGCALLERPIPVRTRAWRVCGGPDGRLTHVTAEAERPEHLAAMLDTALQVVAPDAPAMERARAIRILRGPVPAACGSPCWYRFRGAAVALSPEGRRFWIRPAPPAGGAK